VLPNERLIRLPEVKAMTGASEVSLWRWERNGKFPRRLKISERLVAWRLSEILAWMNERSAARPNPPHAA